MAIFIIQDGFVIASDIVLIAMALTLAYTVTRFFNVALVEYAAIGAYLTWAMSSTLPLFVAVPLAMVLTGAISVVLHLAIFDRLARLDPAAAMIGSLGVALMIRSAIELAFGVFPQQYDMPLGAQFTLFGAPFTSQQALSIGLTLCSVLAVYLILYRTFVGKASRAIAADQTLAQASGLNTKRTVIAVVFVTGAIAALAGFLIASKTSIEPNMALRLLLPAFAAAIAGGLAYPFGAVAAGLFIGLAEAFAASFDFGLLIGSGGLYFPIHYLPAIGFALIVVTLLKRPDGFFSKRERHV